MINNHGYFFFFHLDEFTTSNLKAIKNNDLKKEKVEEGNYKSDLNFDVKLRSRYSIIRGSFEKDAGAHLNTTLSDKRNKGAIHETRSNSSQIVESENKGLRSKIKDQVNTIFNMKEKLKNWSSESESSIRQKHREIQHDAVIVVKHKDVAVMTQQGKEKTALSKTDNLKFDKDSTLTTNSNGSRTFPRTFKDKSLGKPHRKENMYEKILTHDKKPNTHQRGQKDCIPDQSDSDKRKNFSSKVSRGNKLRKSKRIQESHKIFELAKEESAGKQKIVSTEIKCAIRVKQSYQG